MDRRAAIHLVLSCALSLGSSPCDAQVEVPNPGVWRALGSELKLYGSDAGAFVAAPLHWDREDWEKAAGFAILVGGLISADQSIDREAQSRRSVFTDRVSSATVRFGAEGAVGVSVLLLAGGLVFHDTRSRDMGREALEASLMTGILVNLVLKPAFGRERPPQSGGRTDFDPGSGNASFPSGHATEAFAVASVIAARSDGWLVPTAAYTLATIVALDRVNTRAHFASDVFAGAVLGTVTGRFLVARHEGSSGRGRSRVSWNLQPTRKGTGLQVEIRF